MIAGCEFRAGQGIGCKDKDGKERLCDYVWLNLKKFKGSEALQNRDMTDVILFNCEPLRNAQRMKDLERASIWNRYKIPTKA